MEPAIGKTQYLGIEPLKGKYSEWVGSMQGGFLAHKAKFVDFPGMAEVIGTILRGNVYEVTTPLRGVWSLPKHYQYFHLHHLHQK